MVRSVIERALARLDVTVTSAADGGEGLAALEREAANFDLVLLDLTLPVLSGLELMAVIRERWSTLPVVLMSGYSALDVDFASCGARAFLQKPFTVDELGRVTEQVLGARARTGS
jgi:two-component system cell cycle sensor histidine kinase/response regulator CckA